MTCGQLVVIKLPTSVDQADVAECLRKIAEQLARGDVDLLAQQTDVVRVRRDLLEERDRPTDGLLPTGADLEWLSETATLLAQADTYLLLRATTGWDIAVYEQWLTTTWLRLVSSSAETAGTRR